MGLRVRVPRGCSCPPCRRHRPPASGFAELSKSASVCVIFHFGKMAEEGPEGLSNRAFGASVRLSGGFARAGEFENAARGRKGGRRTATGVNRSVNRCASGIGRPWHQDRSEERRVGKECRSRW